MGVVQRGPLTGLAGQLLVLLVLDAAVGLDAVGWAAGTACGLVTTVALARGLVRAGGGPRPTGLRPADRVTLTRSTLAGGAAALTADSLVRGGLGPAAVRALVVVAAVALLLDWVDGQVARRTGTASELGARFDMEVDALLILVLSVYVARSAGAWVLLIGAARYLRLLACLPWPWMRAAAPPRYWAKVVAATQGVVLVVATAGVLPGPVDLVVLVAALLLLAESFGREAWWLRAHRADGRVAVVRGGAADQLPTRPEPRGSAA